MKIFIQTYEKLLACITEKGYSCVIIPALGTGSYGFTHEATAPLVSKMLSEYARAHEVTVIFVVTDERIAEMYKA